MASPSPTLSPPATTTPPPEPADSPSPPTTAPPPPSKSPPPPPPSRSHPPPPATAPPPPSRSPVPPPATAPPPPDTRPPPPSRSPVPPPATAPPPPDTRSPPPSRSPVPPPATAPPPPSKSPPPPPSTTPTPSRSPTPPPAATPPPPEPIDFPPPPSRSHPPPPPPPPSTNNPPPPATKPPPRKPPKSSPPSPFPPPPPIRSPPSHRLPRTPSIGNSSKPKVPNSPNDGGIGFESEMAIAIAACGLLLILGVIVCCFRRRRRRMQACQNNPNPGPNLESGPGPVITPSPHTAGTMTVLHFTFEDLDRATNGFSKDNLVGQGGFGCVYKGVLQNGKDVAVKKLKSGRKQGEREFRSEIEIISRIHHRNLVTLVGYCVDKDRRLLVYDYIPNNSLHSHLHGQGKPVLDWGTRLRISVGAARGIAYLHEHCKPSVIHRDIKSANILLDADFEPLVSDFGLAKVQPDSKNHITTNVIGTFGYLAPEYASTSKLSKKSDVYSFGVVLLELITGRKAIEKSDPMLSQGLVGWARPLLREAMETHDVSKLADPRLGGQYDEREMLRMIEAARKCVRRQFTHRPNMEKVVRILDPAGPSDSNVVDSSTMEDSSLIQELRRLAFVNQGDINAKLSDTDTDTDHGS